MPCGSRAYADCPDVQMIALDSDFDPSTYGSCHGSASSCDKPPGGGQLSHGDRYFDPILEAHRRAAAAQRESFTDDAALAEWAGQRVSVFEGELGSVKVTTTDDFERAEIARLAALSGVRTGNGFDVHAFADGDHVMLAGIGIPHSRGVTGHSDADVALHALVDAILGALAEADIGAHFPPSDPQWKGAASEQATVRHLTEAVRKGV